MRKLFLAVMAVLSLGVSLGMASAAPNNHSYPYPGTQGTTDSTGGVQGGEN
jgi:hypothetical protein